MRINHNIAALNTYRQLSANNVNGQKSLEKLSSGNRINRAGDDAAGLAISEKMRAQIRGLSMASKNSQDAISLIQTAEGALSETHSILQRMRELAVQSSNDTNVSVDRDKIQQEMNQLSSEINRIGNTTEFNTMKLLNNDRAITYSSTVTTDNLLASGTISLSYATNVTGDASMKSAITGGVTVAAGDFLTASSTAGTTYISITYSGSGNLIVRLQASGGATNNLSVQDTIAISSGVYTYGDHGVSFTITSANATTLSDGASVLISSQTWTASNYAVNSNYSKTNSSAVGSVLSNISISSNLENRDIRYISIEVTTTAALSVKFLGSGGATLFQDVYNLSGGAGLVYNNHGITFSADMSAISPSGTVSAYLTLSGSTINLVTQSSTTTTVATTDNSVKFQVGANQNQSMSLDINDMRADALNITSAAAGTASVTVEGSAVTTYYVSTKNVTNGTSSTASEYSLDVSTATRAGAAITIINASINTVSEERAKLGAVQNRLEHTIANLDTSAENLQASESRIRDVDMAKEMMEFTKNNILMQAAQAMLAQANQQPQGVLQLLR